MKALEFLKIMTASAVIIEIVSRLLAIIVFPFSGKDSITMIKSVYSVPGPRSSLITGNTQNFIEVSGSSQAVRD